jgi:hypothetical protein
MVAASALALTACGGEASLGDDAAETWGGPSEKVEDRTSTTLYSGKRKVHTFTVDDGTLYALFGTRAGVELTVELVACAVDDCESQRRTLWRETAEWPSFHSLIATSSELFWVDSSQGRVVGCAIDGCPSGPRTLGWLGTETLITADADFVYWLDEQRLVRCPHAGCVTAEPPPPPNATGFAPLSGGGDQVVAFGASIYARYDLGRSLVRWEKSGGEHEVLYESPVPLSRFDVDAEGVHFATAILTGEVKRCPLAGACGSGEVLAVAQRWPMVVKAAPDGVVWVSSVPDASMLVRLHHDEAPSALAPQTGTLGSIVVSDGYLYWSEQLFPSDIDQIRRVAL